MSDRSLRVALLLLLTRPDQASNQLQPVDVLPHPPGPIGMSPTAHLVFRPQVAWPVESNRAARPPLAPRFRL